MHIVHVIESFAAGSLTALSTLCTHVCNDVRHSILYSLRPETPSDFREAFPATTRFIHVPMHRKVHPWDDVRAYCTIITLLRQLQPDVVHCHSSKAGVLGRLAAWRAHIPCAYTPHSFAFLRTDIPLCLRVLYKNVERVMAHFGQATIACGEEEYLLAQHFSPKNAVCYLIKNSIATCEPDASINSTTDETLPLRVGILGRLTPQRNVPLFSAVADTLQQDAQWIWVGAPREDDGALPPHVQRTGWVNHSAAMAYLDSLDVYMQTSCWEGLSYSILEAMGRGKPVVATDIPANRAIIQHGVTGFLGTDACDISAYVRTLLTDAALRRTMGEAARAYIRDSHNASSTYRAYADIYRAIAAMRID